MEAPRHLLDQLLTVLPTDDRVLAIWTIGSLASGDADAFSDVDLLLAVREGALADLARDWRAWLANRVPTVHARRIGSADRPTITAVTPDWRCFDLTLASVNDPAPFAYSADQRFVRPGYRPEWRFTSPGRHGASASELEQLVNEFIRVLGLLPSVVGRQEYLVSMAGVFLQRNALIELMLIENSAPRAGVKRLNAFLNAEQHTALLALPPLVANRESVIASHLACARLFFARARAVMVARDLPFPEEFAEATLLHLRQELGVVI